jgi:hypothetical protein
MDLQRFAAELVEGTREYIYIRPEDGLIIMRPPRMTFLNETAPYMLDRLYGRAGGPDVDEGGGRGSGPLRRYARTSAPGSAQSVDHRGRLAQRRHLFGAQRAPDGLWQPPTRSAGAFEIAVTYRCQNRCTFCYADARPAAARRRR